MKSNKKILKKYRMMYLEIVCHTAMPYHGRP